MGALRRDVRETKPPISHTCIQIHHPEVVSRLVVSSAPSVILRVLRVLLEC